MKKILTLVLGCCLSTLIWAKDLKIVIPFPAGGTTDQVSRELQKVLQLQGIDVVVEYKVGASGIIAMNHLATSKEPILLVGGPPVLILPILQKDDIKYSLGNNMHLVGMVGIEPTYVVTNVKSNIKSIKDLDDISKTGLVNYGTHGSGTSSALSVDSIFSDSSKVTSVHYKGGAGTLQAILKNEVHIIAASASELGNFITAGTLHPLAVISPSRNTLLLGVPTLRELNPQKFDSVGMYRWLGIFANSQVSKEVIDIVTSLLKENTLRNKYSAMGFIPISESDEEFIINEHKKIQRILKNYTTN